MGKHTKLLIERVAKLYLEGTHKGKYTLKQVCKLIKIGNDKDNKHKGNTGV